jgi:hypothetical protein
MGFIQGLHGTMALVLLCSLLFAEEAGVPLPTPGELTLIAAGLLISQLPGPTSGWCPPGGVGRSYGPVDAGRRRPGGRAMPANTRAGST